MKDKLYRFLLFFLIALVALQFFGKKEAANQGVKEDIVISGGSSFAIGQNIEFTLQNNTNTALAIKTECWPISLSASRYQNGSWIKEDVAEKDTRCKEEATSLEAGQSAKISLNRWQGELFSEIGRYRVSYEMKEDRIFSHEFEIKEPSLFRKLWMTVIFRPIFNTLIFFIQIIPGHNLGLAIFLLTLIIKIILLVPNQKALKAQKKMQVIQPQLEALKIKHKDEPQKLAQETMEMWKKHKVSPAGSCLPLLIQFPILIALFYVVKTDFKNAGDVGLLYESLKGFDFYSIETTLFGILDLTQKNIIVLPVIVGLLQFAQMRLSLGKQKKQPMTSANGEPNHQAMMNQMMIYMMPVMIAFFTAGLPSAVGFYWGTSTLFGILQQMVVNRSKN